ncbi:MAG: hypothetical protein HKN41_13450 [Ilumatobacter sp.]|nr:hypothetical protein [Ilumatobacter sp.]
MSIDLLAVVLVAANVLGAAMAVPQAVKLYRTRCSEGISLSWAVISATVNAGWGWYGIGVGDLGIVPVSVVSVLAYLLITLLIVRHGRPAILAPTLAVVGATAVVALAGWLGGWAAAGIALGGLYAVQLSPAVVSVYRAVDVRGVSVSTWLIALVEAVLWGGYGLARVDIGLLALAVSGVSMSALVLARLVVRRPRRTRHLVPAPAFAAA